jgi:hypothetical protein
MTKIITLSQMWWHMPFIPATWEAEIRRIMIPGQLGKKFHQDPISINKMLGMVGCTYHSNYMGSIKRIVVQAELGKK